MPRLHRTQHFLGDGPLHLPLHVVCNLETPDAIRLTTACLAILRRVNLLYISDDDDPRMTNQDPVINEDLNADQALIGRAVDLILSSPPSPFGGGTRNGDSWGYEINGLVARRLGALEGIDDYLEQQHHLAREEASNMAGFVGQNSTSQQGGPDDGQEENAMQSERKIFLSHAWANKPLADQFRDTLVLGGVPESRFFYSSDRATGIPSGQDVGTYLRESLRGAGLVIELISHDFLGRPMCLMELGAAWVMGVSTYPIVIPPLSREEAVSKVGNVQMGLLGDDSQVTDIFNELYDRLNNLLGLRLSLAAWNRAVTGFRAQLPALSQQATGAHRGLPSSPPRMTKALGRSATSGEKLTFDNISIIEGRRGKQLVAEVTNVDDVEHSASIKATFYDSSNTIVGTRSSVINQVGPGATKTLTIDGVPEHARSKLQIDTLV
jgi:TIR domain